MELRTRRRLRVLAWLLFLSAAPLLLAYVIGYRPPASPFTRWPIPDTPVVGALVVRTLPTGAQVLLDGRIVDERTPAGLGSIPIGSHTVRIEKEGYRPWEKRLEIAGGRVHFLLAVRLVPEVIEADVRRAGVSNFWVSPNAQWLIAREGRRFRVLPFRSADRDPGIRFPVPSGEPSEILWAPDSSAAALVRRDGLDDRFLGMFSLPAERFVPERSRRRFVGWVTDKGTQALLLDDAGTLWSQTVGATTRDQLFEGVAAAAGHPRGVLVARMHADTDGSVLSLLSSGKNLADVSPALPERPRILLLSPSGALAAVGEQTRTLFLLPRGGERWRAVAVISGFPQWSPDGDKLLYQESPFDAWALNVSEERSVLPVLEPELLLRLSMPVLGLRWFAGSQHVMFFRQDILQILEIDPRDGHRVETLASTNRGDSSALPLEDGETVYVTARREGQEVLLRLFLRVPEDR